MVVPLSNINPQPINLNALMQAMQYGQNRRDQRSQDAESANQQAKLQDLIQQYKGGDKNALMDMMTLSPQTAQGLASLQPKAQEMPPEKAMEMISTAARNVSNLPPEQQQAAWSKVVEMVSPYYPIKPENKVWNQQTAVGAMSLSTPPEQAQEQGAFEGTGMEAQAYNILLGGRTDTPEYALAYQSRTQPRVQAITMPDGTTQLTTVTPTLPDSIAKPTTSSEIDSQSADIDSVDTIASSEKGVTPETKSLFRDAGLDVSAIKGLGKQKFEKNQYDASIFTAHMSDAEEVFETLSAGGYEVPDWGDFATSQMPGGNQFLSPQAQRFINSTKKFINSQLRRESGAVISPSEFKDAALQYIPQPGDSPEVLADKARNRENATLGMRLSAGSAYDAFLEAKEASDTRKSKTKKRRVFNIQTGQFE